ncbi:MAG: hypothetical protein LBD28_01730 [Tannerellaceae bacterium]|jgi:hypothetical protein|nr:hypothetical protein [Tannerellaceae bacterium]
MTTQFPESLYDYYRSKPDQFEERTNTTKRAIHYGIAGIGLLLVIFPGLLPIAPSLIIRIVAAIAIIYGAFVAFLGGVGFYSKSSGGEIKHLAVKKFATPQRGTIPGGLDDQKVMNMFANNDWEGLASEPEADDRPLQLFIDEDASGQTFYLMLRRYFSSSEFRGVANPKVISGADYAKYFDLIKSIKST